MPIVELHPVKRRRYGVEEQWFPLLEELGHRRLRNALVDAGMKPQVANGVVWFIDDQMELERFQANTSRKRYRDALEELDPAQVRRLATRPIPGQFNSGHAA